MFEFRRLPFPAMTGLRDRGGFAGSNPGVYQAMSPQPLLG